MIAARRLSSRLLARFGTITEAERYRLTVAAGAFKS